MYKRTIWQDDVEGIQDGTDMSAANFNNMEAGIMEGSALSAINAEYRRYCDDVAKNTEVIRISIGLDTTDGGAVGRTINIPEKNTRNTISYNVIPVLSDAGDGTVGDIIIKDKQKNGFRVLWTGTSLNPSFLFYVSGGMI